MKRPAGTILFTPPAPANGNIIRGIKNMPGRAIAWRQQIRIPGSTRGVSHTAIELGDGRVFEATFPYARATPSESWDRRIVAAYAPTAEWSDEEIEQAVDLAAALEGRLKYATRALFDFMIYGHPKHRSHGMFCSELVAQFYLLIRSFDFSRMADKPKPHQVDPRTMIQVCRTGPFYSLLPEA